MVGRHELESGDLLDDHAAVEDEVLAVHVGGGGGGEEDGGVGDVVDFGESVFEGDVEFEVLPGGGVEVLVVGGDLGFGVAGGEGVGGDAVGAKLDGEGAGEHFEAAFGAVAMAEAGGGDEAILGRDADDSAADVVVDHVLGDALGDEERGGEVDGEGVSPSGQVDFVEVLQGGLAGVVDEDVDGAGGGPDVVDEGVEGLGLFEVGGEGEGSASEGFHGLEDLMGVLGLVAGAVIGDGDVGAALGHGKGDTPADAAAAAGDEGGAADQAEGLFHAQRVGSTSRGAQGGLGGQLIRPRLRCMVME